MIDLSLSQARRLALAAQGFDVPRPARPGLRDLRAALERLGLLQIDFVNVVAPAHLIVPFSRVGPYAVPALQRALYRDRKWIEAWAHEASFVPVECWPLLRARREAHRARPWGFDRFLKKNARYADEVLAAVRAKGPLFADEVAAYEGEARVLRHAWFRSVPRAVLEAHFGRGALAVAHRREDMARAYDLAERVVPAAHFSRAVDAAEATRQLLVRAARALGVATAADLADFWRIKMAEAKPRLAELTESGALQPARVESWREPAYLHPAAREAPIAARALLAPFDPLIFFRQRLLRLFGFDYRFEIFVPDHKRRWGTYVLPFLLSEELVARVDLKSDRGSGELVLQKTFLERSQKSATIVPALAGELALFAGWLGLRAPSVQRVRASIQP